METIPDREILSACLDLLLMIASHQRGEPVTTILQTDKGARISVFSNNYDNCGLPALQEPAREGQVKVGDLLV